jgi:hypothetical protein
VKAHHATWGVGRPNMVQKQVYVSTTGGNPPDHCLCIWHGLQSAGRDGRPILGYHLLLLLPQALHDMWVGGQVAHDHGQSRGAGVMASKQ